MPSARRSHYNKRTLLFACPTCKRWSTVPDRTAQEECQVRGTCKLCNEQQGWILRMRIAALEQVIEQIVERGRLLPDDMKERQRNLYRRKAAQLKVAKDQLAALEAA